MLLRGKLLGIICWRSTKSLSINKVRIYIIYSAEESQGIEVQRHKNRVPTSKRQKSPKNRTTILELTKNKIKTTPKIEIIITIQITKQLNPQNNSNAPIILNLRVHNLKNLLTLLTRYKLIFTFEACDRFTTFNPFQGYIFVRELKNDISVS